MNANANNFSRASDLGALLTSGTTGFTVRKRTGVGMFVHFFLLGCMVVLGASFLVFYKSPEGCVLAVVIGICFALVSNNLEKMKKIKGSLEFMNALFSSALGKNYQFCCIVKNTGDLVFFNRSFQDVFPAYISQPSRKLDTLLALYQIAPEQQEMLKSLVTNGTEGSFTTSLRADSADNPRPMTFYVEPIERPTGFVLLRGK